MGTCRRESYRHNMLHCRCGTHTLSHTQITCVIRIRLTVSIVSPCVVWLPGASKLIALYGRYCCRI